MKKIFTLFAATAIAVAANAESTTASFGSANNSEKDNPVTCPGFTIDGTYVAGGNAKVNVYGEDKGMKLRANKTDNTLILSVDENTTITALVMGVVTNDADQTLPITDVLVDGKSVALEYPIATYNTSNANGSAVINLTDIKATETIGLKFDDAEYTAKNKQVFIAGEVTYEEVAEADPTFPETIDYTINGEKELAGVDVSITDNGYGQSMSITGKSSAEEIALTFAVPEGWDGWIINADWAEVSEQPIAKTRSEEDWLPLEFYLNNQNYKKGNTVTFAVEEEDNYATLALYKGDKVYNKTIDIEYNVVPADGGDEPSDEPLIPESIGITTYADGLIVEQEKDEDDGSIYIDVTGAIAEDEYDIVLDVPEGWDGFLILPFSENITIGDAENNVPGPRKISATDHDWASIELALDEGYVKGNKLTLKANGNWEFAYAFLYKGEQYDYNAYIGITAKVSKEVYKVSTSSSSLDVTQGEYDGFYIVTVTGQCPDDEYTVTIETPEGYDGFIGYTDCDYNNDIEPLKKIQDPDWVDVEDMLEDGLRKTNSLTFPADGEEHWGQLIPYKGDVADIANSIGIEVLVSKAVVGDDPAFPESLVITTFPEEGLEVWQGEDSDIYTIGISGEIAVPTFDVVIDVPEGWDGFISIPYDDSTVIGENGLSPRKTRAAEYYWLDIDEFIEMAPDAKKGNKFTFTPNGEEQDVAIYLYKGDQVEMINWISLETMVSVKSADDNQAAYDAVIAELDALQEKYDAAVAEIKETNPDFDFSMYGEIPVMIEQTKQFAEQALNAANEDGVSFSDYFYGGLEEIEAFISMMLMEAYPAPEFPTSFDVTISSTAGVEMTTDDSQGVFIINVTGKSVEEEITVTVAVPEGFDGFVGIRDLDMTPEIGVGPLTTRAEEAEWWPISMLLEEGFKEGNTMTFPVDGELHSGQFYICKNGMVDVNNQINVEFEVEGSTVGVNGINASENATYYDLQGNQIAKPAKGMYVKVVDGKATKVLVK